jgi:hypothetical protein
VSGERFRAEARESTRSGRYVWTMPVLTVTEIGEHVQLDLGGFARGEGASLQEAADDLISSILRLVTAFRLSGFKACSEFRADFATMSFLYELGEVAAAGGDIRSRVFA